jgi:hypothetical protein
MPNIYYRSTSTLFLSDCLASEVPIIPFRKKGSSYNTSTMIVSGNISFGTTSARTSGWGVRPNTALTTVPDARNSLRPAPNLALKGQHTRPAAPIPHLHVNHVGTPAAPPSSSACSCPPATSAHYNMCNTRSTFDTF